MTRWTEADLQDFVARGGRAQAAALAAVAAAKATSEPAEKLKRQLAASGRRWKREHRFHPTRRWRFDFALVRERIAVELEGGVLMIGRHQMPAGFLEDLRKYNAATARGWQVYRFAPSQVLSGEAAEFVAQVLERAVRRSRLQ